MNEELLAAIRDLAMRSLRGDWWQPYDLHRTTGRNDAEFIAAMSPELVLDLLHDVESLKSEKQITNAECRAKFEAWYSSAPDAEPEPERTYELTDESMTELTKDCIWLGWQAAHGIGVKP